MGFYNMQQGDAPYTKELADNYAMSDNYHQPVMGGTGANSIMLGFGDAIWFSDENGNPLVPPHNAVTFTGGPVDEIENPNHVSGTNNWDRGRLRRIRKQWRVHGSVWRWKLQQLLGCVTTRRWPDRDVQQLLVSTCEHRVRFWRRPSPTGALPR
jgi:hypothetical protein